MEEGSLDNVVVEEGRGTRGEEEFTRMVAQLTELPCIVSNFGQQFVKPCQVVIDMYDGDQIIPYLFKVCLCFYFFYYSKSKSETYNILI